MEFPSEIESMGIRTHAKASEVYLDVVFHYLNDGITVNTSVPLEYRRTGTNIPINNEKEVIKYVKKIYEEMTPDNWIKWKADQEKFWKTKQGAKITKPFFDAMVNNSFNYTCNKCQMPDNPNSQRRIQDLKEFGYTIATRTHYLCPLCGKKTTQHAILPIKRGGLTGYETWSPELRERIIKKLNCFDAFEAKNLSATSLLPDHKFPEIRWDEKTKRQSLEKLTDKEILRDFQLLTNQRNQQKREVCRQCYQTGDRGIIYGIPFFYEGTEKWDSSIPRNGKKAEEGCIGCAWYDIQRWRNALIKRLEK